MRARLGAIGKKLTYRLPHLRALAAQICRAETSVAITSQELRDSER